MFATNANKSSFSTSRFTRQIAWLILLTCFLHIPMMAGTVDQIQFQPGIRNSQGSTRLTANQLQLVAESLRVKAGFSSIYFDVNGWMRFSGSSGYGSSTAQRLLLGAFQGNQLIELHRRDRAADVAFSRIITSDIYESGRTGAQITVYQLQIDFADFALLNGDREARAAFDLGFVLLHEMTHGIMQLLDNNASQTRAGDCEDYINQIRKELGFPVRDHYYPELRKLFGGGGIVYFAKLNFSGTDGRNKRYSLYWDAGKVGNIR